MKSCSLIIFLFMASTSSIAQTPIATGTNTHFSHTETTQASAEQIWHLWTEVSTWQAWDKGLQEASIASPFQTGSKGKLIPDKGPTSTFIITEFLMGESYTLKVKLPFGGLFIKRSLAEQEGMTAFTHEVWFTGPLKGIFGATSGNRYRELLPQAMANLKSIAEGHQSHVPVKQ